MFSCAVRRGILGLLLLTGCSTLPKAVRVGTPSDASLSTRKPALTLAVATLDLHGLKKRIGKSDVESLAVTLRREGIEVLAVQGIARYPTVKTRTDFVETLLSSVDMRYVFGETMNISGRQEGNAVFSTYPVRSHHNTEYKVRSANYESALQVAVDAGVGDAMIISTRLPENVPNRDLASCMQTIVDIHNSVGDKPFIVAGNLPRSPELRKSANFAEVRGAPGKSEVAPQLSILWYIESEAVKLIEARSVETPLGPMVVAQFGLFSKYP